VTTKRAKRKIRRRIENDAYAETARFWRNQRSADRMLYDKPVDRQAARMFRKLTPKKGRTLSEDEIFDRSLKMIDHLDWLINNEKITAREYGDAMLELGKWSAGKRAELEKQK